MSCSLNSAFVTTEAHTITTSTRSNGLCSTLTPTSPFANMATSSSLQPINTVTDLQRNLTLRHVCRYCQRTAHVDAQKICKHTHTVNIHIQWTHKQSNGEHYWCWSLTPQLTVSLSCSNISGQTLFLSLPPPPAWPAKDCLDGSNEDVKIKIDFVTESSQHASEWVPACLSCHCFWCSP